ncbi:MAG: hypothetical protein V1757_02965 [Actinomycetota bacterium]
MTADRGAAPLTLVALLFGGVLMLGLAVDIARFGAAWREASHVAATAAETGAGWINRTAAREGELRIGRASAESAARAFTDATGHPAEVTATVDRVCVTVHIDVHPTLLTIVGAGTKTVTAHACAEPRQG